jgi:hypothetical protein
MLTCPLSSPLLIYHDDLGILLCCLQLMLDQPLTLVVGLVLEQYNVLTVDESIGGHSFRFTHHYHMDIQSGTFSLDPHAKSGHTAFCSISYMHSWIITASLSTSLVQLLSPSRFSLVHGEDDLELSASLSCSAKKNMRLHCFSLVLGEATLEPRPFS